MNSELMFGGDRFWIFQSNVKNDYGFDIRSSCRIQDRIEAWPIKQYYKEIHKGDYCFIWACGLGNKKSGIYSIGEVISDVFPAKSNTFPQYRYGFRYPSNGFEVLVKYIHPITNYISRDVFPKNPTLSQCSIMRYHQATVFPVTEEEKESLLRVGSVTEEELSKKPAKQ